MTSYGREDLDGWEFKILRATSARFKDADSLRRILDEEGRAGWELVEKFDDYRIRLKRRTQWRTRAEQGLDPYRTWVGMSHNTLGLAIAGAVLALVLLVGLIAILSS